MRAADLARPEPGRAAADDGGHRRRVVRRPERRRREQPVAGSPRPAADQTARHLEGVERVERREQPGEPLGEHRLAGAGRPDEEEVVPAGGGDLEGAPGEHLAPDLGEVGRAAPSAPGAAPGAGRARRRQPSSTATSSPRSAATRTAIRPGDERSPRDGSRARRRSVRTGVDACERGRHRQDARHRTDPPSRPSSPRKARPAAASGRNGLAGDERRRRRWRGRARCRASASRAAPG